MAALTQPARISQQTGWLQPLQSNWPTAACGLLQLEAEIVRVLITQVRGSAPREPGVCMLVTRSGIEGTIGGGNLEWQAIATARALLADGQSRLPVEIQQLVLGTQLGQCCGGVVQLWLERLDRADLPLLKQAARTIRNGGEVVVESQVDSGRVARRLLRRSHAQSSVFEHSRVQLRQVENGSATLLEQIGSDAWPLWIYGAGHVGQALVRVLAELPFEVTWIDSRAGLIPASLRRNVRAVHASAPVEVAMTAPAEACHLVMTHDHALDYALCREILARGELAWLGLIGSDSKGARFRSRLRREGVAPEVVDRLVCPIGVDGIASKSPAAIAIAIAAQLLQQPGPGPAGTRMPIAAEPIADCSPEGCRSCAASKGIFT